MLIVEEGRSSLSIIQQMLSGFGAKRLMRVGEVETVLAVMDREQVDLLVCDGDLGGGEGLALVRRIRRTAVGDNRYVPARGLSGQCHICRQAGFRHAVALSSGFALTSNSHLQGKRCARPTYRRGRDRPSLSG